MKWDEYKEWFMQTYGYNQYNGNGCGPIFFACIVLLFLLFGCRTTKTAESEKVDSVRVEYREKIVKVPVNVYVEVPAESKQVETKDSTSFLQTSYARSTASLIWRGAEPFLYHSLENIPQRIEKADSVAVIEKEKIIRRVVRETTVKTVYKEWQPRWWQSALMWTGATFLILVIIIMLYYFSRLLR